RSTGGILYFVCFHALDIYVLCFFFFSSRRRHTRSKRDWSSDVCSSDLSGFFDVCRRSNGENYELQSQARVYCGAKSANSCYVKKKTCREIFRCRFFLVLSLFISKGNFQIQCPATSKLQNSFYFYHLKFLQDLKKLLYQKMTKESTLF